MARYFQSVKTSSAVASGTTVTNLVAATSVGMRLIRVHVGAEGTGAITPGQVVVGISRATARGTQTTNAAGKAQDPNAPSDPTNGVDSAWSGNPTVDTNYDRRALDIIGPGIDIWYDQPGDEFRIGTGSANGIAVTILDNALPSAVNLVVTYEWEV